MSAVERFAEVAYAAMCEAGHPDIIFPAFEHNGIPYLEFDTDDYPEDSDEFKCLVRAEQLALAAVGARSEHIRLIGDRKVNDG